ncbi:MAG: exodeoxyribonuclease VII large subunit [Alistipes sp.]|nr:exodeoxyribonuclease VII large subunit [Alistipes sp.]
MEYSKHNLFTSKESCITLYDLQRMVRSTVEECFTTPLWVSAEISELKVNRSGHCYLNLVEKGNNEGAPRAEARAVIWRNNYTQIDAMFREATGSSLSSGIGVLVRVVVTYHEIYGFSLQIIDLDPNYTLGDVERRRRETIERLKEDGVWDMNRELSLPRPLLRIAVVSSATAAGYRDFMTEIGSSPFKFAITLFEATMQGEGAEESIINALSAIAERESDFDVAVIIRGGGSTSDLALFDSYRIALYVTQMPMAVITGIGHDKDVSVVDMVAHYMCKTPTAVGAFLVDSATAELNTIYDLATEFRQLSEQMLNNQSAYLAQRKMELCHLASQNISNHSHNLSAIEQSVKELSSRIIATEEQRLESLKHFTESCSLDNILKLGFALVQTSEGIITSTDGIDIGDQIEITLHNGTINAVVQNITKE